MAIKWQLTPYDLGMIENKKGHHPFRDPRLSDGGGDLTKQWCIVYYVWSERKQQLVRKRVILSAPTAEERHKDAKEIIREVRRLLRAGYIVDPVEELKPTARPSSVVTITKQITIQQACDYFLAWKTTSLRKNTLTAYKSALKLFQAFLDRYALGHKPLDRFTVDHAFGFFDHVKIEVGLSNKTYNKYLGTLRTLYNFYVQREIIVTNPFLNVKQLQVQSGQHLPYSKEQAILFRERCFQEGDLQLWLFVCFIYYTFGRPNAEIQNLRIGDIKEKTIVFRSEISKNKKTEYIRIPPGLEEMIQEYRLRTYSPDFYIFTVDGKPGRQPVSVKYFYPRHLKILRKIDLAGQQHDMYGWKHTGVIALYLATKDIKLVQMQCRHSSLEQTDKYLRDLGLFLNDDALECFPPI